jgi:NADH-quinone oxidoreductase subunit J
MTMEKIVFYGFASILIAAALAVISFRNSVKAVLSLVLAFFAAAGLWMLVEAEFLAVSLVLVYVGAVLVLFLFVVMMLDVNYAAIKEGFTRYLPLGVLAALAFFAGLYHLFRNESLAALTPARHGADYSNVRALGEVLYTQYFYAFEIAAVLLLVAIIAAISLTFRGTRNRKVQNVAEQVRVKKEDRLRIIKMAAETSNAADQKENEA